MTELIDIPRQPTMDSMTSDQLIEHFDEVSKRAGEQNERGWKTSFKTMYLTAGLAAPGAIIGFVDFASSADTDEWIATTAQKDVDGAMSLLGINPLLNYGLRTDRTEALVGERTADAKKELAADQANNHITGPLTWGLLGVAATAYVVGSFISWRQRKEAVEIVEDGITGIADSLKELFSPEAPDLTDAERQRVKNDRGRVERAVGLAIGELGSWKREEVRELYSSIVDNDAEAQAA